MIAYKARLKASIHEKLKAVYPVELADLDMTPTPDPKMGDLALTFPFQLAKKLRKAPRAIAQEAAPLLASVEGVVKAEVAGAGFLNLWLDKTAVFAEAVRSAGRTSLAPEERKIVIEHTNINPNKAAHIGHLRNACLGDTLARCLNYKGETVEVQNYIDDTGVQVVDVVFGLMELEKKTIDDLEALPGKFDYYCWDLYARVSAYLAD
ncbi:MAG: arginyl-tRNA synthetase, partial [Candidatus Aminicenantes bacterium]|nr:arginyl-tRNA synthetase [Candidatus Aminicenantes bacterium]